MLIYYVVFWKPQNASDVFLVRSRANSATGSENARETAIGIILRTRPDSLKYTCAVTTWLNDCHKFIHCNLRAPTTIKSIYWDFK